MRFYHHHRLQSSPALHWCKISPLFQFWTNLVQNLKPQPILHKYDPQLSAIFRKEAQQPALKSSLPATTLQNSSCPSAFDSHQPDLIATKISAALPSCRHLSSAGDSLQQVLGQVRFVVLRFKEREFYALQCKDKPTLSARRLSWCWWIFRHKYTITTHASFSGVSSAWVLLLVGSWFWIWFCLDYAFRPLGLYLFHCCW